MNGPQNEDQKNLLLAIVLCVGVLMLWQVLFPMPAVEQMPVGAETTTPKSTTTLPGATPGDPVAVGTTGASAATAGSKSPAPTIRAKTIGRVSSPEHHVIEVTNDNGQIAAWILDEIQYRVPPPVETPEEAATPFRFVDNLRTAPPDNRFLPPLIDLEFNGQPTHGDYTILSQEGYSVSLGWDDPQTGIKVVRKYTLSETGHTVDVEVMLTNGGTQSVEYDVAARMRGLQNDEDSGGGMFMPPIHLYEMVCKRAEEFERLTAVDIQDNVEDRQTNRFNDGVRWVGVDNRYFMTAMFTEPGAIEACSARTSVEGLPPGFTLVESLVELAGGRIAPGQAVSRKLTLFGGPKKLASLQTQAVPLNDAIDFGFFSVICVPMLWLMRVFFGQFGNWGLAIILLTILVKLATLPLTFKQYKSMAGMKKIQPEMKKLQEKYKEDKVRMQQELMKLYKDHNVNPLSGCLPMLMMMPIYFALYRTIYSAVELYQADFIFWIRDLSIQDPYYITPLLLGVLMFIQMRLNPSAGDAAQQKIMMNVMPIMFTGMMLFLPSGLVVYILINTLLGIAQQFWMYRKNDTPVGRPAKA